MNYIGSKRQLASWIETQIKQTITTDLSKAVFCDLFAGTGVVARRFKTEAAKIIVNDLEYFSYVLNRNYIGNSKAIVDKERYIEELEHTPLEEGGFIYQNYCKGSGSGRNYFSDHNGRKIDTIRQKIEQWYTNGRIGEDLYYYLLASLLESADKVANTASVYGAYLKHLKKTAQKELVLESAEFDCSDNMHEVYNSDSNDLIKKISGDILYLDPPYNQRQYGFNYHLLNTIAIYDNFIPKGKIGIREYNRSLYSKKGRVKEAFAELIDNADFRYIFLSYNNEGLMSQEEIRNIMTKYGRYDRITCSYPRFKADKTEKRNHKAEKTLEYLHILEKT